MPTLTISSPARQAAQEYSFSVADLVPNVFGHGGVGAPPAALSGYDPVYRADLVKDVTIAVREIESGLLRYEIGRPSMIGLVLMEEPDDAPAYQDAYEWEPVSVRVIDDEESGYIGGGDVWR